MNTIVSNSASVSTNDLVALLARMRGVTLTPRFFKAMDAFRALIDEYTTHVLQPVVFSAVAGPHSVLPRHEPLVRYDLMPSMFDLDQLVGGSLSLDELSILSTACFELVQNIDICSHCDVRIKGNRDFFDNLRKEFRNCVSDYFLVGDHGVTDPEELENGSFFAVPIALFENLGNGRMYAYACCTVEFYDKETHECILSQSCVTLLNSWSLVEDEDEDEDKDEDEDEESLEETLDRLFCTLSTLECKEAERTELLKEADDLLIEIDVLGADLDWQLEVALL